MVQTKGHDAPTVLKECSAFPPFIRATPEKFLQGTSYLVVALRFQAYCSQCRQVNSQVECKA